MDSFEINKLIGAFLGVVFIVFSVSIISDSIFASPVPEKEGFMIEAVEPEASGAAEAVAEVPIGVLLASADVDAGATVFKKCARLPHGREWRPQQGRPQSLEHRRPADRLA